MKALSLNKSNILHTAAFILMSVIFMAMFSKQAFAAASIKKVEYEGKGKVDVNFKSKVKYKNLKVTVKDSSGNQKKAKILDKDNDDLDFKILNYKDGEKYTFTIKGIRKKSESNYSSVSGSITIPKANGSISIKKIEYDAKDKEVSFDFDCKVQWKSPKVTIKKGSKNYVKKIKEKDNDDIEVSVKKLKKGVTYKYTISGIKKKGEKSYTSISGSFTP